jgi:hypothetical protein
MFLAIDRRLGGRNWVFTWENPRQDGFTGEVIEDVALDYDMENIHSWPDSHRRPEAVLGRDPNNPKHYKVFKYSDELQKAGFERLPGNVFPTGSWSQYREIFNIPERVDESGWYEYLDEMDEAARRRRANTKNSDAPSTTEKIVVAGWVARKHMDVDNGISAVIYLPSNAPPDEIRFLEVNDRTAGQNIRPLEFGLDLQDRTFRLQIVDLTSEQVEKIKDNPGLLPPGWSFTEGQVWRRRQ